MPRCHNCGHADRFALLVEVSIPVSTAESPPESAVDCSHVVQCLVCDSTDVPVTVADLLRRDYSSD